MRFSADRRFWMLAVLALSSACVADASPEVPPEDATTLEERPCPEDSYLTYEGFGAPFVTTWCSGCHSSELPVEERAEAPVGIDFDSLDGVRRHAARIWARAGDHNFTMPPVAGPDDEERAMLGEWLACGAPTDADMPY